MPEDSTETYFDSPEETTSKEEVVSEETEASGEQSEGGEEHDGEEQSQFIDGTTFKNVKDLAKAYKELQGSFTRQSQEFKEAKDLLKQFSTHLTSGQKKEAQKEMKKEYDKDPDAFMKDFISDPMGTLQSIIGEAQKTVIEPLQGELRATTANMELQSFLGKHPELSDEDVEPFMRIMDSYPEVRGRKDRLEVWLKLLKTENPEIGKRTTQQKEQLEQGASDAKKAAGLGARKSSTPTKKEGDEFDAVMDLWKSRREKL